MGQKDKSIARDDLNIVSLKLLNFRNYDSLSLENFGRLSILVGDNAVGKTNIIEAIQLVTDFSSFRTAQSSDLIQKGKNEALVEAHLRNGVRTVDLSLRIEEGKRHYSFNGKNKTKRELVNLLPAVVFGPDDLSLVKGSYQKRRESIDHVGERLSANFRAVKSDYQKLVKQKNQALKDGADDSYIDSINEVMVKVGVQYMIHRLSLINLFTPFFVEAHNSITAKKSNLTINYEPSWITEDDGKTYHIPTDKSTLTSLYEEALNNSKEREYYSKRCLIGPHADHIDFYIDEGNARKYASQGQQRSIVLAFKIAELKSIEEMCHQRPILLLDDVMSELDETRRESFIKMVDDGIQAFITTTNLTYFNNDVLEKADIYKLPIGEQ